MSDNIVPVPVVKVHRELTNLEKKRQFICIKGGQNDYYKSQAATSWSASGTSTSFNNVSPPSFTSIMDRDVWVSLPIEITISGSTSDGSNLMQSGYFGFKKMPVNNCVATYQATINNSTVTANISEYIQAVSWYNQEFGKRERHASLSYLYPEKSQVYNDLVNTLDNPLASFNDSTLFGSGRGDVRYSYINNTPTGCVLRTNLVEELMMSPFVSCTNSVVGLTCVNQFTLNITWVSNLAARMLAIVNRPGATITNVTVTFTGAPLLLLHYTTPSLLSVLPSPALEYPIYRFTTYISTGITLAPGAGGSIQSQNIQKNNISDAIYIYARRKESSLTVFNNENYASIESINFTWNTKSGLLGSATKEQLFMLCSNNGYSGTYNDWSEEPRYLFSGASTTSVNGAGCVFKFSPELLGVLEDDECAGMIGDYSFNYRVNIVNRHPTETIEYELYTVCLDSGVFTVDTKSGSATEMYGIVSKLDILQAPVDPTVNVENYTHHLEGSGLWDDIKSAVSSVWNAVGPALGNLGIGLVSKRLGMGGAYMPRSHLQHRLR